VGRFHPDQACLFLQELVLTLYIERRPALVAAILSNHPRLGSHSNIIVYLRNGIIYEYRWGHEHIRPFSMSLPLSCKTCGCLQQWNPPKPKAKSIPKVLVVPCGGKAEKLIGEETVMTACSNEITLRLNGIHRLGKRTTGEARGEWFGRYIGHIKADKPIWWSYDDRGILLADTSRA
jgi:hypothetical protein